MVCTVADVLVELIRRVESREAKLEQVVAGRKPEAFAPCCSVDAEARALEAVRVHARDVAVGESIKEQNIIPGFASHYFQSIEPIAERRARSRGSAVIQAFTTRR